MRGPGNFYYLLAGLLFYVLIAPLAHEWSAVARQAFITLPLTATLIIGVWSLPRDSRTMKVGWGLAGTSLALSLWDSFASSEVLLLLGLGIALAFFVLTAAIALREVIFGGAVDGNRLAGAICIYLLLGISWGILYFFVYVFLPGSFSGLDSETPRFLEFTYFSFVTLTTLGYGEITPVAPFARALAYLEAVAGVMYTTLLVAALVGAHVAARRPGQAEQEPPP